MTLQRIALMGAGSVAAFDPNTLLLISGRGANGSAPVDSSQSANVIGVGGNAAITTSVADPFGASQGVVGFDGSGDSILFPNTSTFNANTTHSLEFFYRRVSGNAMLYHRSGATDTWGTSNGNEMLIYITTSSFSLAFNNGTLSPSSVNVTSGPALATNTWVHCLESYDLTTTRIFINGTILGSSTGARAVPPSVNASRLGDFALADGYGLNGQMAQIRWRNVAVTANFTPPSAPFAP